MLKKDFRMYLHRLLVIAVPIILSNIISQVQMLIDRIFLGRLDDHYMSALSNVTSPMWTSMSFCFSLATGASILISQEIGAGEKKDMEKYTASLMKWNNVIPFVLFAFWALFSRTIFKKMGVTDEILEMCMSYTIYFIPIFLLIGFESSVVVIMQTSNYTKPLLWFGIIRSGLNIFLDYALIFGHFGFPAMGLKGASLATTIAEYLGCVYAVAVFVTSKKLHTRPPLKSVLKSKIAPFIKSCRLGINTALEDFAWNFGNLMLIKLLNSINETAAGIYTIIFSIEIFAVVAVGALGQGTMTISSEAFGKKDRKQFLGICGIAYGISFCIALLVLATCIVFPNQITGLFTKESETIALCSAYLLMMCANLFGKFGNIIVGCTIRGGGDTRWMFFTQIFGTVLVISLGTLFVKVFHMGIAGVFLAVILDELTRAVINLLHLMRISRKV